MIFKVHFTTGLAWLRTVYIESGSDELTYDDIERYIMDNVDDFPTYTYEELLEYHDDCPQVIDEFYMPVNGGEYYVNAISHVEPMMDGTYKIMYTCRDAHGSDTDVYEHDELIGLETFERMGERFPDNDASYGEIADVQCEIAEELADFRKGYRTAFASPYVTIDSFRVIEGDIV